MAFLTAWIPLSELVRIAFGARVLVTAAAGAVGTAAVQIVRALEREPGGRSRQRREVRAPPLPRSRRGGHVRADRRARARRHRVRSRRRRGLRVLARAPEADGTAIAVGYAGGMWQDVSPTWLVGRNIGVHGFYLGRLIRPQSRAGRARREGRSEALGGRGGTAGRRRGVSRSSKPPTRIGSSNTAIDWKGRTHTMTALVTGSAGGIGAAIVSEFGRGSRG